MFMLLARGAVAGFAPSPRQSVWTPPLSSHVRGPTRAAACAALHRQASRCVLLSALAYRVIVLPVALALLAVRGGPMALVPLLPIGMLLLAGNVVAFVACYRRPTVDLGRIRGAVLVDLALAYGVNVVASAAVPQVEVFWSYLAGAVVLTTGAYGLRGGVVAVLLSAPAQVSMVALGAVADAEVVVGRFGWLGSAVAVTVAALVVCGLGVHMAMLYGIRAGREAERARSLRWLHDTVLQTLETIALHGPADETSSAATLAELRAVARVQAVRLRRALDDFGGAYDTPLAGALAELVGEFAMQGLRVELAVAAGAGGRMSGLRREAVLGVVREALGNVAKHARVGEAVVRADEEGDSLLVVVRDHGCGFDLAGRPGFGLRESIVARTREVGGVVNVESWPGRGTRVTLRVPA